MQIYEASVNLWEAWRLKTISSAFKIICGRVRQTGGGF